MKNYPKTKLDEHNECARAENQASKPPVMAAGAPPPSKAEDAEKYRAALRQLSQKLDRRLGGVTVHFGDCSNAAADTLAGLKEYFATIDEKYVYITGCDTDGLVLSGYLRSPTRGLPCR
jgi:hypothetical protein